MHTPLPHQFRAPLFQKVCNRKIIGIGETPKHVQINQSPKCHLVHHFLPFLKIGPFHLEVKLYLPFRTVIHDFFTREEMEWMTEYSKPLMSSDRIETIDSIQTFSKAELRYQKGDLGLSVGKAVIAQFNDIEYTEKQQYIKTSLEGQPIEVEHPPLKDPYSFSIKHLIMHRISKRIELATKLNITTRFGSTDYQTTSYGLAGMVEGALLGVLLSAHIWHKL